jgi:hypothetical protein
MPGYVLTIATPVMCSHGGQAKPVPPISRVRIMGIPAVTIAHTYVIAGCAAPSLLLPPCVMGMFFMGSLRVRTMNVPFALLPPGGPSACPGNPTPLIPLPAVPPRVRAM